MRVYSAASFFLDCFRNIPMLATNALLAPLGLAKAREYKWSPVPINLAATLQVQTRPLKTLESQTTQTVIMRCPPPSTSPSYSESTPQPLEILTLNPIPIPTPDPNHAATSPLRQTPLQVHLSMNDFLGSSIVSLSNDPRTIPGRLSCRSTPSRCSLVAASTETRTPAT